MASLRTALDKSPVTGATDGLAEKRLNYLRGDPADEATLFRRRNGKLLGDIVNSGVAYSGVPSASISASNYASFLRDQQDGARRPSLLVPTTACCTRSRRPRGRSCLPTFPVGSALLPALTSPTYANAHQNFADGRPPLLRRRSVLPGRQFSWPVLVAAGAAYLHLTLPIQRLSMRAR